MRSIFAVLVSSSLLLTAGLAAAVSNSAVSYDANRNVFTLAPIIQQVTPGVVSISTIETEEADGTTVGGIGSGVIIDGSAGLVLTNNHVVDGSKFITVILSDKRRYVAKIRGQDSETDLALLEIPATNLTTLSVSASDNVQVGDMVIAIGNPFGLSHSVSTGIVSAVGRADENPLGYSDLIQTDAAINPGNSGGALVNSAGELIGINSAIVAKNKGSSGIGFAIPAHTLRAVSAQLRNYGYVSRGSLGVMISPVTQDLQARLNLPDLDGAHIVNVSENGPASAAGLKINDVVTHFDGREISNSFELRYAVGLVRPDTRSGLTYFREGRYHDVDVIIRSGDSTATIAAADLDPLPTN